MDVAIVIAEPVACREWQIEAAREEGRHLDAGDVRRRTEARRSAAGRDASRRQTVDRVLVWPSRRHR